MYVLMDMSFYRQSDVFWQYTLCDSTLLFQVYYYRWKWRARRLVLGVGEDGPSEQSCLLGDNSLVHGSEIHPTSVIRLFMQYAAAVAFVMATGVVAYLITGRLEREDSPALPPDTPLEWRIQAIGWISAVLYREWKVDMNANRC